MKRIFMLVFSAIVLLGIVPEKDMREEGKELGIEVLSQEEIDLLCLEKEFICFETNITFESCDLGYDETQNMLLIPQNLDKEYFHGTLASENDRLVFLEAPAFGRYPVPRRAFDLHLGHRLQRRQ